MTMGVSDRVCIACGGLNEISLHRSEGRPIWTPSDDQRYLLVSFIESRKFGTGREAWKNPLAEIVAYTAILKTMQTFKRNEKARELF